MTSTTTTSTMRRLGHREAMAVGRTEYQRFIALLTSLSPTDWDQPTDCTGWDVRAMVAHNLANMHANASLRELAHQMRTSTKRAKASGNLMVDELTALQVAERASLSTDELVSAVEATAPKALAGRTRVPAALRRAVKIGVPAPHNTMTLGFLLDTIDNRDMWMHRIDICRATGREIVADPDHDGRIVAEIVFDWAALHGQPFDLVLTGPAGGSFRRGDGGEHLRIDAVQFCRIVSGRDAENVRGLLATPVLY
jgi:uncharacterized protein (TIGR03083 family)